MGARKRKRKYLIDYLSLAQYDTEGILNEELTKNHNYHSMKNIIPLLLFMSMIIASCTNPQAAKQKGAKAKQLKIENDSLRNLLAQSNAGMEIATFLTFQDSNAEQAMNFYLETFDNSEIIKLQRWDNQMPGLEGKVMHAIFELNGNLFMCSDSPPIHDWDFSPAVSNYIDCKTEEELDNLFAALAVNGTVTMPLNDYGFSKKFGWVIDQFGISWQLNLK